MKRKSCNLVRRPTDILGSHRGERCHCAGFVVCEEAERVAVALRLSVGSSLTLASFARRRCTFTRQSHERCDLSSTLNVRHYW